MSDAKESPSSFRLGHELDREVSRLSEELAISRSQLVRKAVRHFLVRQQHIDEVLAEARKSYADFKASGRGVPWKEASAWLRSGGDAGLQPTIRDIRQ